MQSDAAVWAVTLGFSAVPALLVLVSLLALRGYRVERMADEHAVDR